MSIAIPLIPINDDILVLRDQGKSKQGQVFLAKEVQVNTGTVVALGEGRFNLQTSEYNVPFRVAEGDKVQLKNYGGTTVEFEGNQFLVLKQEDILGLIPQDTPVPTAQGVSE